MSYFLQFFIKIQHFHFFPRIPSTFQNSTSPKLNILFYPMPEKFLYISIKLNYYFSEDLTKFWQIKIRFGFYFIIKESDF